MKNLKKALTKQPIETRPWAIWIWNREITENEMLFQIESIIDKGFGGVAIKPGRDMDPPFLSEDFFVLLECALNTAKEKGIKVRLVEDFSLPWSGTLGKLTNQVKEFRAKRLVLAHSQMLKSRQNFEYEYDCPDHTWIVTSKLKKGYVDLSKIKTMPLTNSKNHHFSWKAPSGEWQVMVFKKEYIKDPVADYLPNVYNSKLADEYISMVCEVIKTRFLKYIPTVFEGFFHEMPAMIPGENSIPWDDDLVVRYRSKHKKELLKLIPSLFFEVDPKSAKNRPHIYDFLLNTMYERFALSIEKWCKNNRLSQWLLCPERNIDNTENMLKDCFAIPREKFTALGIQNQEGTEENYPVLRAMADTNSTEYRRHTLTIIGRNRLGNAATIQSLKSEIDQNTLMGESTIIMDGLFFNLDYRNYIKTPFNCYWYSSEWPAFKQLCDYSSRFQEIIKDIHFARDVAVLLPTHSILSDYLPSNDDAVNKGMLRLHKVMGELQRIDLDFDIITEELLLASSIRVTSDFGTADRIRKGNYHALIVPYSRLISKSVFVFLEKLVSKKGTVIFIDEPPQGSLDEGTSSSFTTRVQKLLSSKRGYAKSVAVKDLGHALEHITPSAKVTVHGKKCADIILSHGASPASNIYFLHNISEKNEHFASIELPHDKYLYLVDCETGNIHEIEDIQHKEDSIRTSLYFAPKQSFVLASSKTKFAINETEKQKHPINIYGTQQRNYRVVLRNQWDFEPDSLNILPLASWSTRIGLSREYGGYSHYYESYFEASAVPENCYLVLTGMGGFKSGSGNSNNEIELTVNANRVESFQPLCTDCDDEALAELNRTILHQTPFIRNAIVCNLKNMVNKGYNRVAMRTIGLFDDPPVILYPPIIAGDFSIRKGTKGWIISETKPSVHTDSWTKYGYPYLSGSGTYNQVFEIPSDYNRLILRFGRTSGSITVSLNGEEVASMNSSPFEVDVTEACKLKRNDLTVRVANTVDNVLRMNRRPSGIIGDVFLDVY
ncbi:MAG: hypothetical protein GF401_00245 [Chitinivibrionales bacterium]|nr:hypothetical protein [Chitinivibrionales bacterium]